MEEPSENVLHLCLSGFCTWVGVSGDEGLTGATGMELIWQLRIKSPGATDSMFCVLGRASSIGKSARMDAST